MTSGLDFLLVGITGLESATSRPPVATQPALNPTEKSTISAILLSYGLRLGLLLYTV